MTSQGSLFLQPAHDSQQILAGATSDASLSRRSAAVVEELVFITTFVTFQVLFLKANVSQFDYVGDPRSYKWATVSYSLLWV